MSETSETMIVVVPSELKAAFEASAGGQAAGEVIVELMRGYVEERAAEVDPEYDAWVRAKIQAAMDDPRPSIPHAEVVAAIYARLDEMAEKKTA